MTARKPASGGFEVHEHTYLSGPLAKIDIVVRPRLRHSHPDGSRIHEHPETGPSTYTIDKDEWRRTTGRSGGGRKEYTAKPSGDQLPYVELDEDEKSFDVIVAGPPTPELGEGPGIAPAARMILAHGLKMNVVDLDAERRRRRR